MNAKCWLLLFTATPNTVISLRGGDHVLIISMDTRPRTLTVVM